MTRLYNVDRRSLLAGIAGVTAAGLILPRGAKAQTPQQGGTLRIGHLGGATSDSLDPATYTAGPVVTAMLAVCNNLVEIDADGLAVPELAESFDTDASARIWTFRLRQDARFSDGRAVTPADVIASFNHHRGENSTSGAKGILSQVKDIRADGNTHVVFELVAGNADFAYLTSDYHFVIMPANPDGTLNWQSYLGTGGYVLDNFEPGVRITLKRRNDYWKQDRAWFDEAVLLTINDATARQNALITGQVDVINSPDLGTLNLLERRPGLKLIEVTGTAHYTMPMFCDVAPFQDPNVRLALKHAVNRQEILDKVLRGHGKIANDSPIAPANRYYTDQTTPNSYDPDKARHYLKLAGQEGLKVEISASNAASVGAMDMVQLFQQSARAAGIELSINREPDDGYWSNVWLKKPFCVSYWNGRPTEDDMFSQVYSRGAEWNESHWDNERFNTLLITARTELNPELRADIYHEMQELVSQDGGSIIPLFVNYIDVTSDKIAHGKVASNRFLDGWKAVERWWQA